MLVSVHRGEAPPRSELDELRARVAELEAELEAQQHRLQAAEDRADHDALTGLWNRGYLDRALPLEAERAQRAQAPLSLLMVDVDHFGLYNKRFGHPTGDEVLRRVARLLQADRRVGDVVARYGGEEFALILPGAGRGAAAQIAQRLRLRVCGEPLPQAAEMPGGTLSISIGVASWAPDRGRLARAEDRDEIAAALLEVADDMLRAAKVAGRNRVRVAGPERRAA